MQDFSQAHTYGTPLLIKPDSYDTKRPFFTEENSNSRDLDVEKPHFRYLRLFLP